MRGTSYDVRAARAADLRRIAAIEEAGGLMFEGVFGELTGDPLLAPAPRGGERQDRPGFLLVAGSVGGPVGFAHVLVVDAHAHLDQLSVHPSMMRRGIGSALVEGVKREAWHEGFHAVSLCTYRDVEWNAPFYARLGFTVVEPTPAYLRDLRHHEEAIGLDRHGARVVMVTHLTASDSRR